jgi:predicted nucleic acid-binding protein
MIYRLFIDSSVLFAAAYSNRGHAHDLVQMGIRGQVTLVMSRLVLEETRRNLAAAQYTALKDAPILAAARMAHVEILVTFDQKHLLGKPELESYAQAMIRTPGETYRKITETGIE